MSISAQQAASHETTDSEYGESSPAGQSPVSQSAGLEEPGRGATEATVPAQRSDPKQSRKTTHSASKAAGEGRKASREGKLRGGPSKEYGELLNLTIRDAREEPSELSEHLPPSQIGASYWTAAEKDALFGKLTRCGPGDLRALSRAVNTKTEAEIHVYLKLLQEGVVEAAATLPPHYTFADIPAAFEVDEDCDARLESIADRLATQINRHDVVAEREKYGEEDWLIDEACAAQLEQQVEASEANAQKGEQEHDEDRLNDQGEQVDFRSAGLLRPETFLQLSRNLFMNGSALTDQPTWHELVSSADCDGTEPAIFRTAFDDFYTLAVGHTRRLIQATLFQSMSRLRASDSARANWQPKAEVREMDVKAALSVLEMTADRTTYWAELPRRCGLEVYSDSKVYQDGRPGTKNGVKLTHEEVEAELGLAPATEHQKPHDEQTVGCGDGMLDEDEIDSDMYTLVSDTDEVESDAAESGMADQGTMADADLHSWIGSVHTKEEPCFEDDERHDIEVARKRKRALSAASFARAELRYYEALDQRASRDEERRLWEEVLRQEPPDARSFGSTESYAALMPKLSCSEDVSRWRDKVSYVAEWERFPDGVPAEEFAEVDERGGRGRKRRAVLQDRVLSRQIGTSDAEGDVGDSDSAD